MVLIIVLMLVLFGFCWIAPYLINESNKNYKDGLGSNYEISNRKDHEQYIICNMGIYGIRLVGSIN